MNARAPRRRISPQARRRCRAIKGFFKRALGSLSQPDLHITSSIAVNVTDNNHRIVGVEQRLGEVCKQCSERSLHHAAGLVEHRAELDRNLTNVIYTKSQNKLRKSTDSDYTVSGNDDRVAMNAAYYNDGPKLKKKKSKSGNRENDKDVGFNNTKQKTDSSFKTIVSSYSTSSFRSLDNFRDVMYYPTAGYSGYGEKRNRIKSNNDHYANTYRENFTERYEHPREEKPEKLLKKNKSRHSLAELDADFIADIIKRQYKPVKFGRRHSDLSQFSTPVCRDYEFCTNTGYNIPEEREARGRGANQPTRHRQCSDARSVCDARLYNAKRVKHRKRHSDAPNDSEIYDLVPVKEKSSPKSRRKFMEDSMRSAYHKEVPPSPRSHRPQLNLRATYAGSDCNMDITRNKGKRVTKHATQFRETKETFQQVPKRYKTHKNVMQYEENEESEDNEDHSKIRRVRRHIAANKEQADSQPENSIVSGLYPTLAEEDPTAAVDTALNKTQDTMVSDKTDKALCEIKDILQSFLIEIKKEASSHTEKANAKMSESGNSPPPHDAGVMTSHRHSFTNFSSAHCPLAPPPFLPPPLPPFANPCCYPMMPMCPINCSACLQNSNCMQNRYPMPSASYTGNNYYDRPNDTCNARNISKCDAANEPLTCETDELIKQIYNFVSQSPVFPRKGTGAKGDKSPPRSCRSDVKLLTSRSAGGSTRLRRHDAKVGTTKMKCASKSCEAIGGRTVTDSDTSGSYSDTALDKLSLEATDSNTRTNTQTELNTDSSHCSKIRQSKFSKVLNSLGLRKKIKRDVIEEVSESESATLAPEEKKRPPFRQHVTNCMMYGQEYYRPPPVSPQYTPAPYTGPYIPDPRLTPGMATPHPIYSPHDPPSAPPYCSTHSYDGYTTPMQPQVPLCLKEVEVKSIGCQSERKLSFLQKIKQKAHTPTESSMEEVQRHGTTQTAPMRPPPAPAPLFNWKVPAPKGKRNLNNFEFNTQKKLALGDNKMRNAMIKKMFYKRNPFSPKNLILKTLLGKDKSSFGEPPTMYRPKMFF